MPAAVTLQCLFAHDVSGLTIGAIRESAPLDITFFLTFVFVNRFAISLHISIIVYSQLKIGFYFDTLCLITVTQQSRRTVTFVLL